MKKILLLLTILLYGCSNDSTDSSNNTPNNQPDFSDVLFQNRFGGSSGEDFKACKKTMDGGYILLVQTNSSDGDLSGNTYESENVWVVKLNSNGEIQWQKTYGGSSYDYPEDIIQTIDGGFIILAISYSSDGDLTGVNLVSPNPIQWMFKIDATGTIQWNVNNGNNNYNQKLQATNDGNFIYFNSFNGVIKKISPQNNVLWSKPLLPGVTVCNIKDINVLTDGSIIITGSKGSSWTNLNQMILKLDSNGDFIFDKTFNNRTVRKTIQTTDGYLMVIGDTADSTSVPNYHNNGSGGNPDIWVARLNSIGDLIWEKAFGGYGEEFSTDIKQDNNLFIISGSATSHNGDVDEHYGYYDAWLLSIDINGSLIWEKTYGGKYAEVINYFFIENNSLMCFGVTDSVDGLLQNTNIHGAGSLNFDIWNFKKQF